MGRREQVLFDLLGPEAGQSVARAASSDQLPGEYSVKFREAVRTLGGLDPDIEFRAGPWDLQFCGEVQLELDEEQHFNRFRLQTLKVEVSAPFPWSEAYSELCVNKENLCIRKAGHGGWWSTAGAARQFGASDPPKVLGEHGSSRWKQRAVYDLLRDLSAAAGLQKIARLSVYDTVGGVPLHEILDHKRAAEKNALIDLIRSRIYDPARDGEIRTNRPARALPVLDEALTTGQVAMLIQRHASTTRDLVHRGFFPNAFRSGVGARSRILIPMSDVNDCQWPLVSAHGWSVNRPAGGQ